MASDTKPQSLSAESSRSSSHLPLHLDQSGGETVVVPGGDGDDLQGGRGEDPGHGVRRDIDAVEIEDLDALAERGSWAQEIDEEFIGDFAVVETEADEAVKGGEGREERGGEPTAGVKSRWVGEAQVRHGEEFWE